MNGYRKSKEQTVRELKREGQTVTQIAAELKISTASVNRYLRPGLRQPQNGTKRKSKVAEGMFDETLHENWITCSFKDQSNTY